MVSVTKEEKEILIKDLCGRLPYGVKGKVYAEVTNGNYDISGDMIFFDSPFDVILDEINITTEEIHVSAIGNEDTVDFIEMQQVDGKPYTIDEFKPYLRPLELITDEEKHELQELTKEDLSEFGRFIKNGHGLSLDGLYMFDKLRQLDWLNAHHFDYRGLIPTGLAIEAPEGMYKFSDNTIGNVLD